MTKSEKIALATGVTIGMIGWAYTFHTISSQHKEIVRLKVDNINLLKNTFTALDALMNNAPVPSDVVNDLEFRRMAFMVEFENIEEEPEA